MKKSLLDIFQRYKKKKKKKKKDIIYFFISYKIKLLLKIINGIKLINRYRF